MTMANCHSSVKNPDTVGMGIQQAPSGSKPGERLLQYSVSNLVESLHRLEQLCWHVALLWKIIVFLIRWEAPFVTLSFWITSLLVCYFMESSQLLASCLALLLLLAGAGGVVNLKRQDHRPPASKPQQPNGPNPSSNTSTLQGANAGTQGVDQSSTDVDQLQKKGKEVLAEYRRLMLLAQDGLSTACEAVERVHAVLGWQDTMWSPAIYGGSTIVLTMLCLLPLRWFIMATISSILSINREFAAVVKQAYDSAHHPSVSNNNKEKMDCRHALVKMMSCHQPEQESKDQLPSEAKPPSIHHDTQHRPLHLCQKSKSLDEAGPNYAKVAAANRNRSSTAPELPTLRLNSAGVPVEVCFLCGTMFSSVLKRRRYCRSCGNQFCQRCCSRKLPRSVFGATSPAALTEKELVCNACFCNMTADEVNQLSGGATIEER